MIEGAVSFRVKSGLVECMGLVVGPQSLKNNETHEKKKAVTSSEDDWISLVSGDP